jgi:hypothetical protein
MANHPRGIVICTGWDARCEQCERFVVDKTRRPCRNRVFPVRKKGKDRDAD